MRKAQQIALVLASISNTKLRFKRLDLQGIYINIHEPLHGKLCFPPSMEVLLRKSLCTSINQNHYIKRYCNIFCFILFAEIPRAPISIPNPEQPEGKATERTVERQEIADKAVDTETPFWGEAVSNIQVDVVVVEDLRLTE